MRMLIFLFIPLLVLTRSGVLSDVTNNDIESVFELMKTGDEFIDLGNYEKYIVVLGLTGSGKSTLIKLLAGDNKNLKVVREKFVLLFDDGNKTISTGKGTLTSRTLYPQVTYDSQSDLAFLDTPGFSDSRSTEHEIAANYFINQVFRHVKNFKIIITLDMNSVMAGGSRNSLFELLLHLVKLLENFQILKHSIVVVATKAPNLHDYSDEDFANDIREFLNEAKNKISNDIQELKSKTNSADQMQEKQSQINLIDLINENSEICVFRMPNKIGIVSNLTDIQVSKADMKLKLNHAKFISKEDIKTGSAISAKGRLYIRDYLLPSLHSTLHHFFQELSSKFLKMFSKTSLITESYLFYISDLIKIEEIAINDNSTTVSEFENMLILMLTSSNLTSYVENVQFLLPKLEYFMTVAGIRQNTFDEFLNYTDYIQSGVSNLKHWFEIIIATQNRLEKYVNYDYLGREVMSIKNYIVTNQNLNIFLANVSRFSCESKRAVDYIWLNQFHDFDSIIIHKLNNVTYNYIDFIQFRELPKLKWLLFDQLISLNKVVFSVMDSKIDAKSSNKDMVNYLKDVNKNCTINNEVSSFQHCFYSVLNSAQNNNELVLETNKTYSKYLYMKTLVGYNSTLDYEAFIDILNQTKKYIEQIINWH